MDRVKKYDVCFRSRVFPRNAQVLPIVLSFLLFGGNYAASMNWR